MPFTESAMMLAVTLLVRVGHMLLISGSVRSKNAAAVAIRLLLDLSVAALALWAIGAAFVPTSVRPGAVGLPFITWDNLFGISDSAWRAFALLPAILIATAALHGAAAERTRLLPHLALTAVLGIVFPLLWQLAVIRMGLPDRHGVGLAVLIGGAIALAGAIFAGPRKGKFNRDQSANFIPGHNLLLQVGGVMALVVAFVALSTTPISTVLAVSAATLAAAGFGGVRFGKIDTGLAIAGAVGGLCVAGIGIQPSWLAVVSGLVVGAIVPWVVMLLDTRFRVDDVTASVAPHVVGGAIGAFAGPLASLYYNGWTGWYFAWLAMIPATLFLGAILGSLVFVPFKRANQLRISEEAEFDGTDLSELDVNAYPDFQQTMIKSYHLREL